MAVVVDFNGGIDAKFDRLFYFRTIVASDGEGDILSGLDGFAEAGDVVGLGAIESEGLSTDAVGELQRKDTHADEVRAVDAFEALGNDGFDAEKAGAFGSPVAAGTGAVFLPGEDNERGALGLIFHAGIVDEHLLTTGLMDRETAFDAGAVGLRGDHEIFDADIRKGASGHDAVIATAAAIAVEIHRLDAVFDKVFSSGRIRLDRTGG